MMAQAVALALMLVALAAWRKGWPKIGLLVVFLGVGYALLMQDWVQDLIVAWLRPVPFEVVSREEAIEADTASAAPPKMLTSHVPAVPPPSPVEPARAKELEALKRANVQLQERIAEQQSAWKALEKKLSEQPLVEERLEHRIKELQQTSQTLQEEMAQLRTAKEKEEKKEKTMEVTPEPKPAAVSRIEVKEAEVGVPPTELEPGAGVGASSISPSAPASPASIPAHPVTETFGYGDDAGRFVVIPKGKKQAVVHLLLQMPPRPNSVEVQWHVVKFPPQEIQVYKNVLMLDVRGDIRRLPNHRFLVTYTPDGGRASEATTIQLQDGAVYADGIRLGEAPR